MTRTVALVALLVGGFAPGVARAQGWDAFSAAFPAFPCTDGWMGCMVDGTRVGPDMVTGSSGVPMPADLRISWFDLQPTPTFSPFTGLSEYTGEQPGSAAVADAGGGEVVEDEGARQAREEAERSAAEASRREQERRAAEQASARAKEDQQRATQQAAALTAEKEANNKAAKEAAKRQAELEAQAKSAANAAEAEKLRKQAEEEARKRKEAEEAARKAEEDRKRAEEERKRAEEEAKKQEAERVAKLAAEEEARKAADAAAKKAEEERKKAEEEKARLAAEEAKRKEAEAAAAANKGTTNDGAAAADVGSVRPPDAGGGGTCAVSDLVNLEPMAMLGKLGAGQATACETELQASAKMTDKDKISRLLMVNAYASGNKKEWERLIKRHLDQINQADPDLCYKYALHLSSGGAGSASGVIRWADAALDNRTVWTGDTYTQKVYSLYKMKAAAGQELWKAAEANHAANPTEKTQADVDKHRNSTKVYAREWYEYAKIAGKDTTKALQLCTSAAATADYCEGN